MTPAWLEVALLEAASDIREVPGDEHNPRILEYHKATQLKATRDEVPWCSAFVCFCLEQCGVTSTRDASARSFENWGAAIRRPPDGAVAVLWRVSPDDWRGHTGFYMGESPGRVLLLSGNDSNRVTIRSYSKEQLLAYRWPRE